MAEEKKKRKHTGGKPAKIIDPVQFENLCKMQCTLVEIASWFDCSEDTIERWCKKTYKMKFKDCLAKFGASGLISLRRAQFKLAEKNVAMAIFLGKNYLGQRDNPETTNDEALEKLDEVLKEIKGVE